MLVYVNRRYAEWPFLSYVLYYLFCQLFVLYFPPFSWVVTPRQSFLMQSSVPTRKEWPVLFYAWYTIVIISVRISLWLMQDYLVKLDLQEFRHRWMAHPNRMLDFWIVSIFSFSLGVLWHPMWILYSQILGLPISIYTISLGMRYSDQKLEQQRRPWRTWSLGRMAGVYIRVSCVARLQTLPRHKLSNYSALLHPSIQNFWILRWGYAPRCCSKYASMKGSISPSSTLSGSLDS